MLSNPKWKPDERRQGFFNLLKMKTEKITLTPELAKELLTKNTKNRKLSERRINQLADEIKKDNFKLTHQGICISEQGQILDGQHRLHGVIKAGKSIEILLTTGADESTFKYIDVGKKRTLPDMYHVEGFSHSEDHPYLAMRILQWSNRKILHHSALRTGGFSIDELFEVTLSNHDTLEEIIKTLSQREFKQKIYPIKIAQFVYWLLNRVNHDYVEDYFLPILTGLTENERIAQFRNELTDARIRKLRETDHNLITKTLHVIRCCILDKNKRLGDIELKTPYEIYDEIRAFYHKVK